MEYKVMLNRILINNREMVFDSPIHKLLDFENVIVIYLSPKEEKEYARFIREVENEKKVNLVALNSEGTIIWQFSNKYIDGILKIQHKSSLMIVDKYLEKEANKDYDLLVTCGSWHVYINPKTGEKIKEEQVK